VSVATFRGAMTRLRLSRDGGAEIVADVPSHRGGELGAGTRVSVSLLERPVLVRAQD
jgi:putative spermidine/putrescine transport system ATP-binding protein